MQAAIGAVLPPRCPGCGAVTLADHQFCTACWIGLRFIAPPWCRRCQLPIATDGALCDGCAASPPEHDGVRAAVAYGPVPRAMALRLKYGGRTALAETMARHMARLMPPAATLLLPVPLHRGRLWSRGFNQAALIAAALARGSGVRAAPLLLRRTRATRPLRGLGKAGRAAEVADAFALAPGARLSGTVVLVDDVVTSGATASACARVLREGGAAAVIVLCWARVVPGDASD